MSGVVPDGPVVVYDDDHYYLGGVVAEHLRTLGLEVTLVTPANEVSTWTTHTEEQHRIQQRLLQLGIRIETGKTLSEIGRDGGASLECIYTETLSEVTAGSVVMVTSREPNDGLYTSLGPGVARTRIGDSVAPGTIATAVYAGHQFAREFDSTPDADVFVRFRREEALAPPSVNSVERSRRAVRQPSLRSAARAKVRLKPLGSGERCGVRRLLRPLVLPRWTRRFWGT